MSRNQAQYLIALLALYGTSQATYGQWYDQYQNLTAIYDRLDAFADGHPDLVNSLVIGNSYEGRPIRAIKIGGTGGTRNVRPAVVLNGTQHAREWVSPMTTMFAAEQLLTGYGSDPEIQSLLDLVDFYVIPVVNPDGYEFSWSSPTNRLWRKNRRPVAGGFTGVDLNRNWDFGWGLDSGSSSNPGSLTYRGPSPFSEPETIAMRDFYLANQNIVSNIDFHSYSQLILYPFGYSAVDVPADEVMMRRLAIDMATSMFFTNGQSYNPTTASDLYLASGISIDWTYGTQSVYSYTVELRPTFVVPGFELPAEEILPTAQEAFSAVLDLGKFTAQLIAGDFDYDDQFDCGDLDALYDALQFPTNKYEFDVNGDGVLNPSDIGAWLASAGSKNGFLGGYLPGDANLDGNVDTDDFNVWNANRFTDTHSWCSGDFNADGVVDVSDFHVWNEFKFHSAVAPVPEPVVASSWLMMLGGWCAVRGRRMKTS